MLLRTGDFQTFAANGGQLFDPSLPPVVFLHGAGLDHSVWALHSRWFAHNGWSVLALDLPGHGRSGGQPLASIQEMADWLARLIEVAGASRRSSSAIPWARSSRSKRRRAIPAKLPPSA